MSGGYGLLEVLGLELELGEVASALVHALHELLLAVLEQQVVWVSEAHAS